jgi:prephenate dehydrogenase
MGDVLVVGCGLLGASIGLALRGSELGDVLLADRDDVAVSVAVERGAGRRWDGEETVQLAVVAIPPALTAGALVELQSRDLAQTYTHVSSVQSHVQDEVERLSSDPSQIVGGHPLAGREVSGPRGALADLFVGRPWAVCASETAGARAVDDVVRLALLCGAVPVRLGPAEHDSAVALLSHVPQVVSSALAGRLADGQGAAGELELTLSGPGLVDTTRLAASNPELWTEILSANAARVAPHLRALSSDLESLAAALEDLAGREGGASQSAPDSALAEVEAFLRRGNRGRDRVPVKRGELAGAFAGVRVELADEPGQMARLLVAAGDAGVNVEDLRVEHVPGRQRGVIELLVSPTSQGRLRAALAQAGWHVFTST